MFSVQVAHFDCYGIDSEAVVRHSVWIFDSYFLASAILAGIYCAESTFNVRRYHGYGMNSESLTEPIHNLKLLSTFLLSRF